MKFDVTSATPFSEPQMVAATLFAPDDIDATPELVVCLPGATCTRFYYDARFPGLSGYSLAEYLTDHGRLVLTLDHLGMGDSSQPEPESRLDRIIIAKANHLAVKAAVDGLRAGRWFAPRPDIAVTGVGHSMGGMMAITQQARFRSFDRLAVLGWTNIGLALPDFDPAALLGMDGYVPPNREAMRALFNLPDVPAALIAMDDALASVTPACLGRDALKPEVVAPEASEIDCPVFVLYSQVDVSPDPHGELAYYSSAHDITLMGLDGAAHMHNYATTRERYWARLDAWIGSTAG